MHFRAIPLHLIADFKGFEEGDRRPQTVGHFIIEVVADLEFGQPGSSKDGGR